MAQVIFRAQIQRPSHVIKRRVWVLGRNEQAPQMKGSAADVGGASVCVRCGKHQCLGVKVATHPGLPGTSLVLVAHQADGSPFRVVQESSMASEDPRMAVASGTRCLAMPHVAVPVHGSSWSKPGPFPAACLWTPGWFCDGGSSVAGPEELVEGCRLIPVLTGDPEPRRRQVSLSG